jgi:hypothetical protein
MTGSLAVLVLRSPVRCARVAQWTWSQSRRLCDALHYEGTRAISAIGQPPAAPGDQRDVVAAVLQRVGATCLVSAAILQRWDADHDRPRPLIIGVERSRSGGFAAHAWLDGDDGDQQFVELHRIRP